MQIGCCTVDGTVLYSCHLHKFWGDHVVMAEERSQHLQTWFQSIAKHTV